MRHTSRVPSGETMDPRIARTQRAVVDAATDLLVEGGPTAVTVDAIVARSGVAKSTIYRHWESRDDILISVIEACAPDVSPPPPEIGFVDGLYELAETFRRLMLDPNWARIIPSLLQLKQHLNDVAAVNERIGQRQRHALDVVIERGIAEGYLAADLGADEIAGLIVGPLLFGHLTGTVAITPEYARLVVDTFLAAHARRPVRT